MPCCTYFNEWEVEKWRGRRCELDRDFVDVINEYEKLSGEKICITWRENHTRRLFRKPIVKKIYCLNFTRMTLHKWRTTDNNFIEECNRQHELRIQELANKSANNLN